MKNIVVVGSQWGDEGKGKIVDWLSEQADVVIRFQGGHNAGHTLVIDGVTYKLRLLPSGIVRKNKISVIGNGVVVDPWALLDEIKEIREKGVEVNPENEVLPLMGSKEGIMHVSLAFLNPGDEVLIPNPGYPTYLAVTKLVEAKPRFYNLSQENNWFPDIEELEKSDLSKVRIMWINYPHMPTGASATIKQFEQLINFAKKNNILIINDNPYSFILNDNHTSLLSVDNSKEVAMELNSLSKSFNMSGWRVGMLLGSLENVSRVLKVKSNMDSGMFYGVQKGAIAALNLDKSWFEKLNIIYTKRRELIWKIADILNCTYDKNSKGLFVWAKLPDEIKDSEKFIDYLLNEKKIFVAPGTIFGSEGEGYIRFSLCIDENNIIEALKRLEK